MTKKKPDTPHAMLERFEKQYGDLYTIETQRIDELNKEKPDTNKVGRLESLVKMYYRIKAIIEGYEWGYKNARDEYNPEKTF